MRKSLPLLSLLSAAVLLSGSLFAQSADNFAYSMTDAHNQNNNWVNLRILDLNTGTFSGALINGMAEKQMAYDAISRKPYTAAAGVNKMGFNEQPAFNSGVAALALDSGTTGFIIRRCSLTSCAI